MRLRAAGVFPALLVLEGIPRPLTGNSGGFYTLQAELLLVSPLGVQFGYSRALEAVSVRLDALTLIVSWVGRHQVVGRRIPEMKTGFWQVVHLKERTLLRLQGHRSFEIVVHQCGVPSVDGGLQQQGPKVECRGRRRKTGAADLERPPSNGWRRLRCPSWRRRSGRPRHPDQRIPVLHRNTRGCWCA